MAVKVLLAVLFLLMVPAKVFAAFQIENISPTEVTSSDQELTLFVSASNLSSSTQYFQVAITKEGNSNYFGYTQNNSGNWNKYASSPDLSSILSFTPVGGVWNGEIKARLDAGDSGFSGPGTYQVKLLKYITASGTSSNNFPINVTFQNQVENSPIPTQAQEVVKEEKTNPTVQFSIPGNLKVGEEFEISYLLQNFESGSYFVKARIGKDASHLTLGQTNNGEWLTDTDSWSKFPKTDSGGKIKVRLSPQVESGDYKIRLSFKKGDDSPIQSTDQTANFKENPNPQSASVKATPTKASTGIVLAAAKVRDSKESTIEAEIAKHYENIDLLGTKSAKPESRRSKVKKALNLLLSKKTANDFPIGMLVVLLGIGLLCTSGAYIVWRKFFMSQDE